MTQKELNEGHEKAIGRQLLNKLQLHGKLLRHGKDGVEPDLIYSLDSKSIGIEIATVFFTTISGPRLNQRWREAN